MAPRTKKLKVDADLINSCLPCAPKGYRHEIQQQSSRIYRVITHCDQQFIHRGGEPSWTTWGFIKGEKVHRPKNYKMAGEEVCHLLEAGELSGYTSIIPTKTSLLDLG